MGTVLIVRKDHTERVTHSCHAKRLRVREKNRRTAGWDKAKAGEQ